MPVLRTVDQARTDVHNQILLAADPLRVAQEPDRVQARISFTIPVLSLTDEAEQLARTEPGEPDERQTLDGPERPSRADGAEAPVSALVAAAMAGLPAEARHAVKVNAAGHACLDGVGAIDLPTALALLPCSPEVQRIFTHPITGSVLAVDRYVPGPGLRRLLTARDGHCRYPGCRRQAEACEADHTTPHRKGGATANSNLALLCRHHHRTKHTPGYQLRQAEDGELEWITPAGQRLADLPERTHLPGTLRRRVIFQPSQTHPGTVNPDVVTEPAPHGPGGDWGVPEEPNWNDPTIRTTYLRTYDPLGNPRPEHAPTPPQKPDPEPGPDPEPDPELDEPPF